MRPGPPGCSSSTPPRPFDGPVISFDQMGPISLKPIHGAGWRPAEVARAAARDLQPQARDPLHLRRAGRPPRPAATPGCDPAAPAATCSPSCARSGSCYPARQRLYWIQDNLSANWTPDIRKFAADNKIELVPTPTYASYLNRIESHFRPIQEFVFNNTDYPDWDAAQRALADYITHRNGTDRDRRIAVIERKHRIAA